MISVMIWHVLPCFRKGSAGYVLESLFHSADTGKVGHVLRKGSAVFSHVTF